MQFSSYPSFTTNFQNNQFTQNNQNGEQREIREIITIPQYHLIITSRNSLQVCSIGQCRIIKEIPLNNTVFTQKFKWDKNENNIICVVTPEIIQFFMFNYQTIQLDLLHSINNNFVINQQQERVIFTDVSVHQNRILFCSTKGEIFVYSFPDMNLITRFQMIKTPILYMKFDMIKSYLFIIDSMGKFILFEIEMIKRFKEQGALISFDVNFRGNLWTGAEAKECIESILPYVDVFFCSEDTARLTFLKEGDVKSIMKSFTEEYPISIVASTQRIVHSPKRHTFGSVIYSAKEDTYYEEPPYADIEVVDRIGSGDAYISGVLYGLLAHENDYRRALEYGNATSALKNTIPGDLLSTDLKEIDGIIREHKSTGRIAEMDR